MLKCLNKNHPQIKELLSTVPSEYMVSKVLSNYPDDYNILQYELVNSSNDLFNTKLIYESEYNKSIQTTDDEVLNLMNDISSRFNIDLYQDSSLPVAGRYTNGKIYINLDKANTNTVFHELAHPIVQIIKDNNEDTYVDLISELYNNHYGIELLSKSKELYNEQPIEIQEEEALVELIANYSSDKLIQEINNNDSILINNQSLFDKLKYILKQIGKLFVSAFGNKNSKLLKDLNSDLDINQIANLKSISDIVQVLKYGTNINLRTSFKDNNTFSDKTLLPKLSKQSINQIIQMFKEGNSITINEEQYHKDNIDVIIVNNVTDSYKDLSELTGARLINTNNEVVYIPNNVRLKDSYISNQIVSLVDNVANIVDNIVDDILDLTSIPNTQFNETIDQLNKELSIIETKLTNNNQINQTCRL